MELQLTTPALLFPAISLLLLAYTNRFLTLATLIRSLHTRYREDASDLLASQIRNLRFRVVLIRNMQAAGVLSLLLCVVCMFVLFEGWLELAKWVFASSLVLLIASLAISSWEIHISVRALDLQLSDLEESCQPDEEPSEGRT